MWPRFGLALLGVPFLVAVTAAHLCAPRAVIPEQRSRS